MCDIKIEAKERLIKYGVKPSLQRMAIMEYLMSNFIHPTADKIYNDLYPAIPTLSKTTVYNTLNLLSKQGAILALNIDEKNVRYDVDISKHAHFQCKSCGSVYDVSVEDAHFSALKSPEDLLITECHIYYKGYCRKCRS